jgi:hypothetical protein
MRNKSKKEKIEITQKKMVSKKETSMHKLKPNSKTKLTNQNSTNTWT